MIRWRRRGEPPSEDSRLAARDLVAEAVASLLARPGRAALTGLGTVAGIGAFVATLGLTTTAEAQVSNRFDAIAATEVLIEESSRDPLLVPAAAFPTDGVARVLALNGVVGAGRFWRPDVPSLEPRADWLDEGAGGTVPIIASDPELFDVLDATLGAGRAFDAFHVDRSEPVAVLGALAALRMNVSRVDGAPTIFLGDSPFTVIGIIDDVARRPDVLTSIVVPESTARRYAGPAGIGAGTMIVETDAGAAQQVAAQAPVALRPDAPELFAITAPPDPRTLRNQVSDDLTTSFFVLAAVSLLISAFGIANTTLVSVLERVPEIGLRRAVGARRHHIAAQFIGESGALGLLGGVIGACFGLLVTVFVSFAQSWTAVLDLWTLAAAPALGAFTGLVAGLYPAIKAASVAPAQSLRAG